MLRVALILISSFMLTANSTPKLPVVIYSNKVAYNKILNVVTYEGAVKIDFDQYHVLTNKIIINTYKKNDRTLLENVEFPEQVKIVKNDLTETVIAPNAIYNSVKGVVNSQGEIYIQKGDKLFVTKEIEISIGQPKSLEQFIW